MKTIVDEVKKLPVAERADLFLALREDIEMKHYLDTEGSEKLLFNKIARRDAAYRDGTLQLTTLDDLATRLNNKSSKTR